MLPSDKMHLRCSKKSLGRYFSPTKCIFAASKSLWTDTSLRRNASSLLQKASGQMLPSDKMHLRCHKKPLGRYFSPTKCIFATPKSLWAGTFLRRNASSLLQKASGQILSSDKMYLCCFKKSLADTFLRRNAGLGIFLMLFLWLEDVFPKNPVNSHLLDLNGIRFN